ncbi:Uridylate kinase [Buchnera aphidicola (Cinara kochiana kochiana)]|uniref:Uridylate kinase n=1 Tax=Buchnera aphidicola (Cinara kochiana kochiana) TaxID=2518976 RepID=A0A451D5E8_9GAMM|nr:UMP kinase [Buchnera aphidicola]VFP81069.1 Uridylate kinase [Buchnera aphidicola (Cinara kochiana kochiana)]
MKNKNKYNRILLKISGEFLKDNYTGSINIDFIKDLVDQIYLLTQFGIKVGLVVGGGNLFRGSDLEKLGMRRTISDHVGMLSTVINGLLIYEFMQKYKIKSRIFSSTRLDGMCERYRLDKVNDALENGYIAIFCFGLGVPFFTTDSAACIYGIEIKADILLKGTKVDGVYSSDPLVNSSAKLYHTLKYKEALNKKLKFMDYTSLILAYENKLPILVFDMHNPKVLHDIVINANSVGTLIY